MARKGELRGVAGVARRVAGVRSLTASRSLRLDRTGCSSRVPLAMLMLRKYCKHHFVLGAFGVFSIFFSVVFCFFFSIFFFDASRIGKGVHNVFLVYAVFICALCVHNARSADGARECT